MKNLVLFFAFFLFILPIKAQWTNNGANLTTSDNVGIGLNPYGIFNVKGGTSTTSYLNGVAVYNNAGTAIRSALSVTSDDHGRINLYNSSTHLKVFINSLGSSFFNGGNVGIGTSDPEEQLDVNGKIQVDHLIRVNAASATEGGEIGLDGPSGYNDWRIDNRVGHFRLHHSGTVHLQLNNNGNLGIGTTSTGSHKLAVEGSIGAREVKVEASGWSDFVFEKDYDLPTLEEVENHIKTNGHLKDIPSAKEVEENGVKLGEINAKLLQKIEELTLYTIQQQKEIENLKRENEEFKSLSERLTQVEQLLELKK